MSKDTKRLGLTYLVNPNHVFYLCKEEVKLLQLYLSTLSLDSSLQVLSFVLRNTLLNSSRSTLYESLSFFQTETASLFNCLNNLELCCAYVSENNVKRRLFFS